jgi:excisionase family DNA binding protein
MSKYENAEPITARLLTVPEAAAALRISRSSVYQLIRAKQLEIIKIGRSTRVPAAAIDGFVELFRKCQAAGAC